MAHENGGYGPPPETSAYGPPISTGYGPPPVASGVAPGTPLPPGYEPPGGYTPAPPAGQFGQPAPYNMPPPAAFAIPPTGSRGLGIALGLCGGFIGLGLVYALAKGPETKKGAVLGFGVFFALCALSQLVRGLLH